MAITFVTPVNVTPATKASWQLVDDASVPDGASGVLLEFINANESDTDLDFGCQHPDSTDNRATAVQEECHSWAFCGVDGQGRFECYAETTDIIVWLHGYFNDEATFNVNADDISFNTPLNEWTDVSIATETGGETAVAALLEYVTGANDSMNVRKKGSTDNRPSVLTRWGGYMIVGVDGTENFQAIIDAATCDIYLKGWLTKDVVMRTNAINRVSEVGNGSYADLTAPDSSAIGVIYHTVYYNNDSANERYGIRPKGSSRDVRWGTGTDHAVAISQADGNGVVQGLEQNASGTAWWEMGYFTDEDLFSPFPTFFRVP